LPGVLRSFGGAAVGCDPHGVADLAMPLQLPFTGPCEGGDEDFASLTAVARQSGRLFVEGVGIRLARHGVPVIASLVARAGRPPDGGAVAWMPPASVMQAVESADRRVA
jgi:hypothetical protein